MCIRTIITNSSTSHHQKRSIVRVWKLVIVDPFRIFRSRIINLIDQVNLVYASTIHREKNLSHFDLNGWVTGGTKIRPGKGNWRIFESIWLSMLNQFDSQCWVNLTLNFESIWLSILSQFESQFWVNLTLNVQSIWLSMLSQFDSRCWVN